MEKMLEKSMCNAVRRKRYVEKNPACYHVMMLLTMMMMVVITDKQRIPSWQITPHV